MIALQLIVGPAVAGTDIDELGAVGFGLHSKRDADESARSGVGVCGRGARDFELDGSVVKLNSLEYGEAFVGAGVFIGELERVLAFVSGLGGDAEGNFEAA